ncbi:MAG: ArnT family glycosyltransferase [Thermoleophilia bacterium]
MPAIFRNHPLIVTGLKLLLVVLVALAITIPFANQPFSFDGPLILDFASSQVEDPLRQHIDNFDYFGVHFDQLTDTHPRFLSLYLSLVIRAAGGISELPIHLSLVIFPVIGGVGMFFLGRRFGVSGVTAALLFLTGPAFMVSSHVEMVDVPAVCLWVAALAAFIYGVDHKRVWLLVLASLLFILTFFTIYQGLTVLGLALVYLLIRRRLDYRALAAVLVPVLVFGGYLAWFHSLYGELPHFKYRFPIDWYDKTVQNQLEGLAIILSATVLVPIVTLVGYCRTWRGALAGALAAAVFCPWFFIRWWTGEYSLSDSLELAILIVIGIVVCYSVLESTAVGILAWFRKRKCDILFPCCWFIAVFLYCSLALGYTSPRYFLPAAPPVVLILLMLWRSTLRRWPAVRVMLATVAIGINLIFAVALSLAYLDYANEGKFTADWAHETYGSWQGRVWFNGELGYAWYMRQNGFTMVPNIWGKKYSETAAPWPQENPVPGDIIISSGLAGNWLPFPEVLQRMRPLDSHSMWSTGPIVMMTQDSMARWTDIRWLPWTVTNQPIRVDEITVWLVTDEPLPLIPEVQKEVDKWE